MITAFPSLYAAEQAETARLIREAGPPPKPAKEKIYAYSYYEQSNILQGVRRGRWSEWTETIGYSHQNIQVYSAISRLDRFDVKDYTANFGSYATFKNSYAHLEAGFGWDIDYIYNFQTTSEYAHRLYKDLYWQIGYNYRNYDTGDSHLLYPGVICYFGDSYLSADCGAGFIESRDTAYFGTVKGNFAITKFLRTNLGVAFGERLYDINALNAAQKEFGYILFGGLALNIYKDINAKIGCSYSTEKPKFIKRSLDFALSLKF